MNISRKTQSVVKLYLRQKYIKVPDEWLNACVEWIEDEYPDAEVQLNNLVYEQWLQTDLSELNCGTLPHNLTDNEKYNLNEAFCVQVNSLRDVGASAYSQYQKLKGTENENAQVTAAPTQTNWEPKASRMLMMNLTDGNQDIFGMEYKPIPQINVNLPPGTKLLLQGNILCRHGVLMLTRDNVQILGGEVEQLQIQESQIQVLARCLNVEEEIHADVIVDNQPQVVNNVPDMMDDDDGIDDAVLQAIDDPWQDGDDDMDLMLSQMPEPVQHSDIATRTEFNNETEFDTAEIEITDHTESDDRTDPDVKRFLRALNWPVLETFDIQNTETGVFRSSGNIQTKEAPFTYLSQVEKLLPSPEPLKFRVKAYISTLTGKLDFNSGRYWSLSAKINDGTASVEVDLDDQFLAGLIGYTAEEMANLRRDASKNPAIKSQISNSIKHCQKQLVELYSILELEIINQSSKPCVKRQFELTMDHVNELKSRISDQLK